MTQKVQSREERRKQLANKNSKKKGKPKNFFKKFILVMVALGIIGILTGVTTFAIMVKDTPELKESLLKDPISSKIYDINGELVREIGSERRDYVAYENIPKIVEEAVLATEDVRFYDHNGIDIIRLGGAVIANITDGFGAEGASTITQQVVKNSFLTFDKTLNRKAQEAWLSFQLERKYTKEEIFEMYFNKIYMSENMHGIATASKVYFGKDLKDIELHEAALLAGMPQSPNNYNPFVYPEKAEQRRNVVLMLMNKHGFITKEQMEEAQNIPVETSLVSAENRQHNKKPYDSFIDVVIDEVEKYGDFDIFSDGLEIYTTLDQNAQTFVETMLNTNEYVNYPNDDFQAGITLLDSKTGEIRAIGGGRNQKVERGFNFATDTQRQPGSTIKPIIDYGPAIEHLKWGTYHVLNDERTMYSDGKTEIRNWDNKHQGPMSMRVALGKSRNTTALQALQAVGLDKAKEFATNLGIPLEEIYEPYAIGGFRKGVSPLQLAGAYSAFANNGFYTEPHAVKKIKLRDGTEIDTTPETEVVMKDYTAFMITDMLKSVMKDSYGTGRSANIPSLHVAGKTGTTNYTADEIKQFNIPRGAAPDAWFAGYTTNYTAAIWTGYKDRKNYLVSDGYQQKIAQILFKNLMTHVSNGIETPDFAVPNSVEKVAIEKDSIPAKLAGEFTPKDQIIYEYAVKGNAPKEVSTKYDKLDSPKNVKAKYNKEDRTITLSWDYEGEGIKFEVIGTLDEGPEQSLGLIEKKGLMLENPVPGGIYTFTITAVREEIKSDPVKVTIQVPEETNSEGNGDGNGNGNGGGGNDGGDDDEEEEDGDGGIGSLIPGLGLNGRNNS